MEIEPSKAGFNRLYKALTNNFGVSVKWLLIGGGHTCSRSVTYPVEILELAGEKWGGLDVENP